MTRTRTSYKLLLWLRRLLALHFGVSSPQGSVPLSPLQLRIGLSSTSATLAYNSICPVVAWQKRVSEVDSIKSIEVRANSACNINGRGKRDRDFFGQDTPDSLIPGARTYSNLSRMHYPLTLCTYSVLSYSVLYRTLSNKEPLLNSLDVPLACSVRHRSSARKCLADVITKNFFQHICQWTHHHQFLASFAP